MERLPKEILFHHLFPYLNAYDLYMLQRTCGKLYSRIEYYYTADELKKRIRSTPFHFSVDCYMPTKKLYLYSYFICIMKIKDIVEIEALIDENCRHKYRGFIGVSSAENSFRIPIDALHAWLKCETLYLQ